MFAGYMLQSIIKSNGIEVLSIYIPIYSRCSLERSLQEFGGNIIARRHGPVIWMALHNEGDWWMDTYIHEPTRASDDMYLYNNPPVV